MSRARRATAIGATALAASAVFVFSLARTDSGESAGRGPLLIRSDRPTPQHYVDQLLAIREEQGIEITRR